MTERQANACLFCDDLTTHFVGARVWNSENAGEKPVGVSIGEVREKDGKPQSEVFAMLCWVLTFNTKASS